MNESVPYYIGFNQITIILNGNQYQLVRDGNLEVLTKARVNELKDELDFMKTSLDELPIAWGRGNPGTPKSSLL